MHAEQMIQGIVEKDGKLFSVFVSSVDSTMPASVFQVIVNVTD